MIFQNFRTVVGGLKRGIFVIHLLLRGRNFFRLCHARRGWGGKNIMGREET
jgi:hypothetical protein